MTQNKVTEGESGNIVIYLPHPAPGQGGNTLIWAHLWTLFVTYLFLFDYAQPQLALLGL